MKSIGHQGSGFQTWKQAQVPVLNEFPPSYSLAWILVASVLTNVSLAGCSRLTALPVKMGRLTNLSLSYTHTQAHCLPLSLAHTCSLTLTLTHSLVSHAGCSRLTALPVKMGRLTNLSRLNLEGVKLVTPPSVVLQWQARPGAPHPESC